MRRTVLFAALLLVSASAQAGQSRNLSLAGTVTHPPISAPLPPTQARVIAEAPPAAAAVAAPAPAVVPAPVSAAPETGAPPVATAPVPPPLPAAAAPTTSETPKYVERPAVTPATADTPKTDDGKPSKRADRRHHRGGYWTAGRIMGELQRYGVYW